MRIHILIPLLLGAIAGSSLFAQPRRTLSAPVVYSIKGNVNILPTGETTMAALNTGTVLDPAKVEKIQIGEGAEVGFFFKNAYAFLAGPAEIAVAELTSTAPFRRSNAIRRLAPMLNNVLFPAFAKPSFGFGSGGGDPDEEPEELPAKKEKPGGGNKDREINVQSPLPGKAGGETLTFHWTLRNETATSGALTLTLTGPNGKVLHRQQITDEADSAEIPDVGTLDWKLQRTAAPTGDYELSIFDRRRNLVYRQTVEGNTVTLRPVEAKMEAGKTYLWEVKATDRKGVDSGPIQLDYRKDAEYEGIRTTVESDPAYRQATPVARLLLLAAVYENNGYLDAARQTLRDARELDENDELARILDNAFKYQYELISLE